MVAAKTSQKDIEAVRRQIRRLFWLMNDESGGLCWNAPEAIAEMIVNVPDLAGEYVPNLFSYMDEEPFEAGVRWAVHRLVREMPDRKLILDTASLHLDKIIKSLSHENPRIRAFAVLALKTLGPDMEPDCVVRLSEDKTMVPFYDMQTGILKTLTVSEFPGM